jgi:predicted tellurium resistance membrane protein TerC
VVLIADGVETHVPKGYIYFAMAFSLGVEMVNIKMRKHQDGPVALRKDYPGDQQ